MINYTMVLTVGLLALMLDAGPIPSSEKTTLDAYGDALPAGATARFGSLRLRLPKAIEAVAVSADGKLVAAVNMEGKVAVWEREGGRLLHQISGSAAGAASVAFSPDGNYLATGGRPDYTSRAGDFRIRLWDLKTGRLKTEFPPVEGSPISKLLFTSDSAILISAGVGQPVTVWRSPNGEKIREFPTDDGPYHDVALSPDEKWLAVSGDDLKTVDIYSFNSSNRARKLCKIESESSYFESFEFSPDSKSLVTHQHDDGLCFWDIATGKIRSAIVLKHDINRSGRLAPDGKKVALLGSLDRDIHWLDAGTGKPLDSWKGGPDTVWALTFSRDGKTVVTGDWGAVRVWDAATGKVLQQPSDPSQIPYTLNFSADGKTVLAASKNCLYFLDGRTLQERTHIPVTINRDHLFQWLVALSPDGSVCAFLGQKDEIMLVDPRQPRLVRTLRCPRWPLASLDFSPDGKQLYATGHKSAGLRVWNVQTGQESPPLDDDILPLSNLSIARRAEKLAVVVKGAKPYCRLWDLRTGKEEPGFPLDTGPVKYGPDKILLSEDGNLLVASHVNSHLSVWDVSKQVERHRFKFSFEDGPWRWAFSTDSNLLVTTHADGCFRTWNMANGKPVAEVRGQPDGIAALACSPDGTGLVSACTGCTILRWQKSAWQQE